jgi:hypothetical protein
METIPKVAIEFKLKNSGVKPISSIYTGISSKNLPTTYYRDEDCRNKSTQPSQQ